MLRRILCHGLVLCAAMIALAASAAADCRAAFPIGVSQVLAGHTMPGIKNDFSEPVQIKLAEPFYEGARVVFGEGEITAPRLADGGLTWTGARDGRWGSHCLNLPEAPNQNGATALLILSWDPQYKHPNLHGLVNKVGEEWVFRGFLDNAAQQFHEAAIELRWSHER